MNLRRDYQENMVQANSDCLLYNGTQLFLSFVDLAKARNVEVPDPTECNNTTSVLRYVTPRIYY